MPTQTTVPNIPVPTGLEAEMSRLFEQAILPETFAQAGYAIEATPLLSEEDYEFYRQYRPYALSGGGHAMMTLQGGLHRGGVRGPATQERYGKEEADKIRERYREIDIKIASAGYTGHEVISSPLSDITTQSLRRVYSPATEEIFREHGADSEEYKAAVKEFEQAEYEKKETNQEMITKFQENTMKFLSGDFAMNDEEKASMAEFYAPTREAVGRMYEEVGTEIDKFDEKMTEQMEKFDSVQRQLFEQGIEDYSTQATMQVLNQAASMGRDPADPDFQAQIGQMVSKEAKRGGLELEREQLLRGERHQQDIFNRRLGLAEAKGTANVGIEDQVRNMRTGSLTGGGSMMGQSQSLVDAISQQRIANLGGTNQMAFQQQGLAAQMRGMGAPTTTTQSGPSDAEIGLGLASIVTGGFAGVASAGALRAGADAYNSSKKGD